MQLLRRNFFSRLDERTGSLANGLRVIDYDTTVGTQPPGILV